MGEINVGLTPIASEPYSLSATFHASVMGRLGLALDRWRVTPIVNAAIEIADFQRLVQSLSKTKFSIPAPFHILSGRISLGIESNLEASETREDSWLFPLYARTDLRSVEQRVDVFGSGFLYIDPKDGFSTSLDFRFDIRDFTLQLPRLNPVVQLPGLTRDGRFTDLQSFERAPASAEEVRPRRNWNIRFQTTRYDSIKLKFNLADPYVPLSLNLTMRNSLSPMGSIEVREFQIGFLEREAKLEYFYFRLPQREEDSVEINALLTAEKNEYRIYMEILGTIEEPRLELWSSPSLSTDDIIALFLFNRPLQELGGGEQETVGQLGAAIADGALGLLGIWLFASTPIESVYYNPSTRTYSAQVRLDDDTTVEIGSDLDAVQVFEIRRRLANNWVLSTLLEPGAREERERGRGEIMLQWEVRY